MAAARQHASSGLTCLSHRLAKQFTVAHGDAPRNLVFSPLCIYSALSLVAAGAHGKTLRELLDLLGTWCREDLHRDVSDMVEQAIPDSSTLHKGGPRVSYASGVWHDSTRTLKPTYRDVVAASFRSVVGAVDFNNEPELARILINSWVAEATNNLIHSILARGSVDSRTRLVVTNAIYFKGSWDTPFKKQMTKGDKFHRLDGSTVTAQFMNSSKRQFIGVHDGFKVLRMPYTASRYSAARYSMCVLLPDTRDGGLQSLLIDAVMSSPTSFLKDHWPLNKVDVGEFRVPRFKMSFSTAVRGVLHDLGVQAVFSGEAELPDLLEEEEEDCKSHDEPLFLGDVLHKAVIEVNEEGTKAAAVTAATLAKTSARGQQPPPRVDFVADHPFAFFVVEELSGAILLAGHVLDPTQQS